MPTQPGGAPIAPDPDDKDWTWVLERACPECGFDGRALDRSTIPTLVHGTVAAFGEALARPHAGERPSPAVWSPLEYACHVRDVCALFDQRLQLMLTDHDPQFANWDQDETAIAERYWEQHAATVAREMGEAGAHVAASFAAVSGAQWERPSRRSNGSVFTVDTFGRYFIHDLVHHVHDIGAALP